MFVGFRPLKRYFEFGGRSGRSEYWQFVAIYCVGVVIALALDFNMFGTDRVPILTILWVAGLLIPMYAVLFRRLHDRDKSGWLVGGTFVIGTANGIVQALSLMGADETSEGGTTIGIVLILILVIASVALNIYIFVQTCMGGDPDDNRFGPPDDVTAAMSSPFLPSSRRVHDPLGQIERLGQLRTQGLLTDEEFEIQKAAALRSL